jgi:hypothetical protein
VLLDLRCNFNIIAMITTFCTVVLSVIQEITFNIGVLPFSKGRALHIFIAEDTNQDTTTSVSMNKSYLKSQTL